MYDRSCKYQASFSQCNESSRLKNSIVPSSCLIAVRIKGAADQSNAIWTIAFKRDLREKALKMCRRAERARASNIARYYQDYRANDRPVIPLVYDRVLLAILPHPSSPVINLTRAFLSVSFHSAGRARSGAGKSASEIQTADQRVLTYDDDVLTRSQLRPSPYVPE